MNDIQSENLLETVQVQVEGKVVKDSIKNKKPIEKTLKKKD